MGRSPCCDKVGLKKGPWTPEEDQKLLAYIEEHGHGSWRALPPKAGLQRCGKSCRLRWSNYLRPDIKRGKFTVQEEQAIIQLHALLGNRWSAIATHLPKRTDNEIKNYWNTHLKKRLDKMGIDPVTHKTKNDSLLSSSLTADGQSKNAANLSHMAQWESARLEAEARLVRQSKLRSPSFQTTPHDQLVSALDKPAAGPHTTSRCLDILTALNDVAGGVAGLPVTAFNIDLESPTSTLSYSENASQVPTTLIEFAGNNNSSSGFCVDGILKESEEDWKFESSTDLSLYKEGIDSSLPFTSAIHDNMTIALENEWTVEPEQLLRTGNHDQDHIAGGNFVEKFTDLLLSKARDKSLSKAAGDSDHHNNEGGESGSVNDGSSCSGCGNDYYEDNKNYWNSILNLVNASSPSDSMF